MTLKIVIFLLCFCGYGLSKPLDAVIGRRMTLEECLNIGHREKVGDPAPITVYLYNLYHYDYMLTNETWDIANIPNCDDIRFLIHGHHQTRYEMMPIIDGFGALENTSVIMIEWEALAAASYKKALASLDNLGLSINYAIDKAATKTGQTPADFHILAFGLGAQAAGRAGRMRNESMIGTIIAMDPTVSGFDENNAKDRQMMLNRRDAMHVRVLHTDADHYGVRRQIGHADYYINGGRFQPGCNATEDVLCDHLRILDYMAEAVAWPRVFIARRCASWYDILYNYECRVVPNEQAMYVSGEEYNCPGKYNEGIFFLATNDHAPYYYLPPQHIYVAHDVIHVSHTYGKYGSDYILPEQCKRKKPGEKEEGEKGDKGHGGQGGHGEGDQQGDPEHEGDQGGDHAAGEPGTDHAGDADKNEIRRYWRFK